MGVGNILNLARVGSNTDGSLKPVSIAENGLVVEKRVDKERFSVPSVSVRIRSERTEPVAVRLIEEVPKGVSIEDIGFRPEYGAKQWTLPDASTETFVFKCVLAPDEEIETLYGIRDPETDFEAFLTEPLIETSEDLSDGSAFDDGEVGEHDRSWLTLTSRIDDDTTEIGVANSKYHTEAGITAALAEELREGSATEEDLRTIINRFAADDSTDARIKRLQTEMSDLQAYTAALEEILDEHGSVRRAITDLTDQLETVRSDIDALDDRVVEHTEDIDVAVDELTDARRRLTDLEADIEQLTTDLPASYVSYSHLSAVRTDVDDRIKSLRDNFENNIDALCERQESIETWRSHLSKALLNEGDPGQE